MIGLSRLLYFKQLSLALIAIWLLSLVLLPTLMVVIISLLPRGDNQFVTWGLSLDAYRRLFDPLYARVFWNSTWLAGLTTLWCLVIGYPFAYLLTRTPIRWRNPLLLLVIIPFWTSSLIRAYAMVIILKTNGLLNSLLLSLGLIQEPLRLLYTELAVIIGLVYSLLPFMSLPLYASLEKLDPRLLEAARDLGANRLTLFRRVMLPLTLPGIIAGGILVFLPALGMFYMADLLGGAKVLLLGNLIKNQFLAARDWPFGAAISVTLLLLMALLIALYAYFKRRDATGK